jgi:branched-chain amino acid transport system substrate-binding protein
MFVSRTLRLVSLLIALAMLAACGQKAGVHVGFAGGGGGGGGQPLAEGGYDTDGDGIADSMAPVDGDGDGQFDGGGGDDGSQAVVAGDDGSGAGSGGGGGAGGGEGGGGGTQGAGSGGSGGGGQSNAGAQTSGGGGGGGGGGDSTGITQNEIIIGVHAPLTGAAPIPQRSFHAGKDQYWNVVGKVYGRTIKVVFRDDKYNPSAASQVCQELIIKEKVFILSGSGGTDQIAECARVAAAHGVPYLSAGVTRVRLDTLPNYFAQSMSYPDQMPLLFQWIRKNAVPANKKVGLIASNTANFDDAVKSWEAEAKKAGYTPVIYRPSKQASDGELGGIASRMVSDQVTVATPIMQPTAWIKMAKNPQLNNVKWAGVGVTMGLNSVANVVCPNADGAMFFSPFPGFNLAKQMAPKFPGEDDIQWAQWGSNVLLHEVFKRMDGNLTREAFAKAMLGKLETGIFPSTSHTANDHFRVDSVHALHLNCGSRQFVSNPQRDLFRKSF